MFTKLAGRGCLIKLSNERPAAWLLDAQQDLYADVPSLMLALRDVLAAISANVVSVN